MSELVSKLQAKEQELKQYSAQILAQQKEVEALKQKQVELVKFDDVKRQLYFANQQKQQLEMQSKNDQTMLLRYQQDLAAKQNQSEQLVQQTNLLQRDNEKLNQLFGEASTRLKQHVSMLNNEAEQKQKLHIQVQAEMEKFKQVQKEFQDYQKNSDSMHQQFKMQMQAIQMQNQQDKSQLHHMQYENDTLRQQMHEMQSMYQSQVQQLQEQVKNQQEEALQTFAVGEVLFEEDLPNPQQATNASSQQMQELVKLLQVVDFFDKTKPDGLEIRSIFFNDQNAAKQQGKFVLLSTGNDLDAFDHFCKVVRGSSQQQHTYATILLFSYSNRREKATDMASLYIMNYLQQSSEECRFGISCEWISNC